MNLEEKKEKARIYYATAVDLFKDPSENNCKMAVELLDKEVCIDHNFIIPGYTDDPLFLAARVLRGDIWYRLICLNWDNYYEEYLKSLAWKTKRDLVMHRDNNRCPCGTIAEIVHHKTYQNVGKEPLYDLVSLCKECHDGYHVHTGKPMRRWRDPFPSPQVRAPTGNPLIDESIDIDTNDIEF